jgi:ADP-heptose:LPS heptosyltransferase
LRKILVLRFSAMGDVVLLVPVVKALVETYPDVEVTVVTRPKFASFFTDLERVVPFPADVDYTYNGIFGMRELFRKLLRRADYEVVIDMHDHIRTMVMRTLFKLFAVPVVVVNKGREEKKKFTQKEDKVTTPLPHTASRYAEAFAKAGFPVTIGDGPYIKLKNVTREETTTWLSTKSLMKKEKWIGIAPFAMHLSKIWPTENYASMIQILSERMPAHFFLFGGGDREIKFFESLQAQFPESCTVVAGQLKIKQELALMEQLDLMVCVDSSNMHLSSLMDIPTLSIWGGTHPDVGFSPYGQPDSNLIQVSRDDLPCRPCSVYGRETCFRGDFACLTRITPEQVAEKAVNILSK